jgi:glycosyltransferase involved in cell wall biosynthesis
LPGPSIYPTLPAQRPRLVVRLPRAALVSMRLLHVYSGNLFGGVERMLVSVSQLDGAAQEHAFALCFEGRLSAALRGNGARVELLPSVRIRNPISIWRARGALQRFLWKERFDAVVCHGIWAQCIFGTTASSALGASLLFLHDLPEPANFYYRWAWRSPPQLCIANSRYTGGLVGRMRPGVPVKVVYPLVPPPAAVSASAVARLRGQLGAREGDVVLCQGSRLDSWKGHRILLRALGELRLEPDWQCWIAGEPQRPKEHTYLRELLALAGSLGIAERVRFIGHRQDMPEVLAACDVYCQPNETPEPFGMVFVEALYAGKPVVACASGGALEIVTPDCGTLCTPHPRDVARAIKALCSDRNVRLAMGERAVRRARELCGPEVFRAQLRTLVEGFVRRGSDGS